MNIERGLSVTSPTIIAGPCAAESKEQVIESAEQVKKRGIEIMRASIIKPRTKHGWDGVGNEGIPMLIEVAKLGVIPATEILDAQQAEQVMNNVLSQSSSDVVLWIGSRNQNHVIQRNIGSIIANEKRVKLGIKNQPWASEDHWKGIVSHVVEGGGADPNQLFMIHRGFAPENDGLRNPPDFEMAARVKSETGIPMLIDPSHIGGEKTKVIEVSKDALAFAHESIIFDGLMIEVHPSAHLAKTDAKQQLGWDEYDQHIAPLLEPEFEQYLAAD